ncbi:hypothetical protein NHP200010_08970 [Helicobacter bizzozeronii]|uniref:hypothetical protein n=1 Tax=Helicobacter bizzozeronii TaxID=56877 RepID=UPI000CEEA8EB|nr:hypothetical protein [Helicobacter bizzozeronii]GMB93184.1 hypothetical protein NHP200010_08970 [Helicobacter bizzozeronii]
MVDTNLKPCQVFAHDRISEDSKIIRMQVLKNKISYFTTLKAVEKVLLSLLEYSKFSHNPPVSLQELQG